MKARTLKTLQPDPGTILWLPETDPTHTITSGCLDHPVLILSSEPSGIRVCLITTFKSTPIRKKFPYDHQRSHRMRYIPLAPADPHPDTHEILYPETTKKPSVPKAGVESYVRLHEPFVVPCGILLPLDGGTARLSKQDMEMVMRKVQGSRENKSKVVSKWPWGQAKMQREAMEYKGRIYGSRSVGGVLNDRWTENSLGSLCLDDEYGLLSDRFVRKPAGDVDENGLWRTLKFIIGLPIFVVATLLSWLEWLAYTVVIGIPSFILRTIFLLVTWLVRAVLFVVSGIIILSVAVLCAKVLIACTVFMVELSLNFHKDYIACLNYGLCR